MKIIKISIAVLVLLVICIWVFCNLGYDLTTSTEINTAGNNQCEEFRNRISSKIDSLEKFPTNEFCKTEFTNIQYIIDDNFDNKLLGSDDGENKNWHNNLSSDLYAVYANKFVDQVLFVFKGSEWDEGDISFIRTEVEILKKSKYLDQSSPRYQDFQNIGNALRTYDEIRSFIAHCNSGYGVSSDIYVSFPIDEVKTKMQKARYYLDNNLDNQYVNNCTRLKERLREIPEMLFMKHVNYLENKIIKFAKSYDNNDDLDMFVANILVPLSQELKAFEKDDYGISQESFDTATSNLAASFNKVYADAEDYY